MGLARSIRPSPPLVLGTLFTPRPATGTYSTSSSGDIYAIAALLWASSNRCPHSTPVLANAPCGGLWTLRAPTHTTSSARHKRPSTSRYYSQRTNTDTDTTQLGLGYGGPRACLAPRSPPLHLRTVIPGTLHPPGTCRTLHIVASLRLPFSHWPISAISNSRARVRSRPAPLLTPTFRINARTTDYTHPLGQQPSPSGAP